jgi:hypothetical protein
VQISQLQQQQAWQWPVASSGPAAAAAAAAGGAGMQYVVLQPGSYTASIATSSEPSRSISNASSNLTSQSSGNQQQGLQKQLSSVTVPSPVAGSYSAIPGQMQGMMTSTATGGAPSGGFQLVVVSEAPTAAYTQQQQPQPQPLDYQQAWVAAQSQGYMQQPGQQQQLCFVQPQQQQQQMLPQGSAPMYVMVQPTYVQQPNVQQQDAAQQQQASQVAMCYPVASGALLPQEQLQHDLQALSIQHTDNAGAAALDLAHTLSLPTQYVGPGVISPVMPGGAIPAAAGTSSGPISGGISGIAMASGVHDGLQGAVHSGSHTEVLQSPGYISPVDPQRLNMSLQVTPRVPLQQCIDVLSPQLNNASMLSGANITMLVGGAAVGAGGTGETIVVSITGTQQQVTAAWQLATSILQQPALSEVAVLEQS